MAGMLKAIRNGLNDRRGTARDPGQRSPREEAFAGGQQALSLLRAFEEMGSGWFWQTDRAGRLTYLTAKVANEIRESAQVEPIGQVLTDIFQIDSDSPDTERTLVFHMSSRTSFAEYSIRLAPTETGGGDEDRWWSISGKPLIDPLGHFQGFVGHGSDLTAKRRSEAEITKLALFDGLTGLANRQRMRLSLDQTLAQGRASYRSTALFLLDLDRFKQVNDTLGHQTGDLLLKQVAQRLQRAVGEMGLVGRLGGDEFQVVIPNGRHRDDLSTLSRTIIDALSQPYFLSGSSISIGCSIGVAVAPDDGEDSEILTRNADLALYAAKADGRGVHRFYKPEMLAGAQVRKRLEDDLRLALTQDQLHLVYQPVVSIRTRRIVGHEALIRWDHPVHGPISPTDFIPIAEESGLIETIGEWVLRTACTEAATWPSDVRVAVNVSPVQFANPALPSIVTNALARSGLAPDRLELEITEGVFLSDDSSSSAMFRALKNVGVRLALDDFGTGYSSLGYLRQAPFDKIKIDQSFVKGAAAPGNRNAAIIKAIVTLADTLGMETTAEGVEIQDEIELIRDLGCTHIQGYVYGKPRRCDEVVDHLTAHNGTAEPEGYRISRPPRVKMLRRAMLEVGDQSGEIRIRNMSTAGALIDGIEFPASAIGMAVRIELIDGQMFGATVRWTRGALAGIGFDQPFNMDRLAPQQQRRILKRA